MKSLSSVFLKDIYTKQEAYALLDSLTQLDRFLYSTKVNVIAKLSGMFSEKKTKSITDFLKKEKIDLNDPEAINRELLAVKEAISRMQVVMIQLAIEPTEEILSSIVKWFEKNSRRRFLLDIQVNKALIGGLVISKQGLYKDYSVKKEFDRHFSSSV